MGNRVRELFIDLDTEYCKRCKIKISEDWTMQELGNALLRRLIDQYKVENSFLGAFSKSNSTEMERLSNEILCNRTEINIIKGLEPGIALSEAIREEYGLFCNQLKTTFRTTCFATTPYSQLMWGGAYANNHKGFCIEYTVLPNEKAYEEVFANLFPVVYCKVRPDMTKRLVNYKDKEPTVENLWDIYLHGALRKSIDWAYQNEWRLLLPLGRKKETDLILLSSQSQRFISATEWMQRIGARSSAFAKRKVFRMLV